MDNLQANEGTRQLYDVILADPPWPYNFSGTRNKDVPDDYETMKIEDICNLPIPASDNAVLFLWACWPLLYETKKVIEAWGFEYKTIGWVWVKANKSGFGFFTGMGFYTRSNTEPCLFAVKGKTMNVANMGIQSLIYAPVREHSRKPDEQYVKIEKLYPNANYLELFARRNRKGWSAFGNEVKDTIELVPSENPVTRTDAHRIG